MDQISKFLFEKVQEFEKYNSVFRYFKKYNTIFFRYSLNHKIRQVSFLFSLFTRSSLVLVRNSQVEIRRARKK